MTRLLVLKESSYSEWTPILIDSVKQVFMKYISEGVLHESSVLNLLISPTSTIPVLEALDQITGSGSEDYASPSCIGNIFDALFKILGDVFRKGNGSDYTSDSISRHSLISHAAALIPRLLKQGEVQHNVPLTFKSNTTLTALEAIVSTFTTQDDKKVQAEAASILGSIASADPEAGLEMANFPGLLQGLGIAMETVTVDHHQNYDFQAAVLDSLAEISAAVAMALSDIRLSMGSSALLSILKGLAKIGCESKYLSLQYLAVFTIFRISDTSFFSEDLESIRILKSLYEEGLFEGIINLVERHAAEESDIKSDVRLQLGAYAAAILTYFDPAKSKKLLLNSLSRYFRGEVLAELGQYEDSLKDLEEGSEEILGPSFPSEKIYVKVKLGDLRGALADADSWIKMNPPDCDQVAFQERGILKRIMGDLDGALMDLDLSLRFFPDDYEVLKHRAYVKFLMGDEEGARADAEHALSIDPRYVDRPAYKNLLILGTTPVEFLNFHLK